MSEDDQVWIAFKILDRRGGASDDASSTSFSSPQEGNVSETVIHNVKIGQLLSCDCGKGTTKTDVGAQNGNCVCPHISFVMTKVLKVPSYSCLLSQKLLSPLAVWALLDLHDPAACDAYHHSKTVSGNVMTSISGSTEELNEPSISSASDAPASAICPVSNMSSESRDNVSVLQYPMTSSSSLGSDEVVTVDKQIISVDQYDVISVDDDDEDEDEEEKEETKEEEVEPCAVCFEDLDMNAVSTLEDR